LTTLEKDVSYLESIAKDSDDVNGYKFGHFIFECFMEALEIHATDNLHMKVRDEVVQRLWAVVQELRANAATEDGSE